MILMGGTIMIIGSEWRGVCLDWIYCITRPLPVSDIRFPT